MGNAKTVDRRDAPGEDEKPESIDEWGVLMSFSHARLDLASDMLPAGLSDRPRVRSLGD